MHIETRAIHSGRKIDPTTGAVTPPIHMSTTFQRATDGSYPHGYIYGRIDNPNRKLLEECINELEGGAGAAAFSSGMSSIMSVFQALSPGDHIIAPVDIYHGTARLLSGILSKWNLRTSFVDVTDLDEVKHNINKSTRIIYVETPSNPLLKITDIKQIAEIAHQRGILCLCDNTWGTPILQRPLELGADLVVHSNTKYIGGHGDVMGGAVISAHNNDLFKQILLVQQNGGSVPSPFDCWLLLRSIRTLPYRVQVHSKNAHKLASFLEKHSEVLEVLYPGLVTHPGHAIAKRQMNMYGGMLSFRVKGGQEMAFKVAANTKLFTRATSLGSYESLIEHRSSVEGPNSQAPEDLLRLSIGLENVYDLIADLDQALHR